MRHVRALPDVEERLTILKQFWVPVDVQTIEPSQYRLVIDPENALILREVLVSECLLKRRCPSSCIPITELTIPSEVAPGIFDQHDSMSLHLLDLKDAIGVITDQSDIVLIRDYSRANRDQAVIVRVALFDPLPDFVPIEVLLLDPILLRKPACHDVQVSGRVAAHEIVPTVQLEIGFFEQTHPELTARRVGAQPISIIIHWEIIINIDAAPRSIHKHFYDVLTSWIIDRVPIVILRENVFCDDSFRVIRLEFKMRGNSQCREHRAIADLLLHDLVTINLSRDVWHPIDELVRWDVILWAGPLSQLLHLSDRERQEAIGIFVMLIFEYAASEN